MIKPIAYSLSLLLLYLVIAGCSLSLSPSEESTNPTDTSRQLDSDHLNNQPDQATRPSGTTLSNQEITELMESETYIVNIYPGPLADPERTTVQVGDFVVIKNLDSDPHRIQFGENSAVDIPPNSAQISEVTTPGTHPITIDQSPIGQVTAQ